MKESERETYSTGDFHKRVWCEECGYNYNPSHDDPTFGPKYCPECGNYRGTLPDPWDLPDRGWTSETVRKVHTGVPKSLNPLEHVLNAIFGYQPYTDKKKFYEDRSGNRINV